MRVAVMQPYLFPYLGYFQLLHCVDAFVLLDDVSFIKKGWINRNQLLVNERPFLFTIPLVHSSQNKLIKDMRLQLDSRAQHKLLATIKQTYKAAPEFKDVFPVIEQLLLATEADLTARVHVSLERINAYVGMSVPILRSSALAKNNSLLGQDRIIEICHCLNAHEYVNMLGGAALYTKEAFSRAGIDLKFLQPTLPPYKQRGGGFVPGLSIIDVLMYNTPAHTKDLFQQAVLV